MVLLKNKGEILPVNSKVNRIAVIGAEAVNGRLGGYSGKGNGTVNFLEGIRARSGKIQVQYAGGVGLPEEAWETIPSKYLHHGTEAGLYGEYFNNLTCSGEPVFKRVDPQINYSWTLFAPDARLQADHYSVRWSGTLTAPVTGKTQIGLEGNDGYRLYLDGKLIIDRWNKQSYSRQLTTVSLEANRKYALTVEFYEAQSNARIRLIWTTGVKNDWRTKIDAAVAVARTADLAIVTAGIHEGEFQDRAMLGLQGHQEEMIRAVAATGKPVVVVLTGGSAITMGNWINEVSAVLYSWYSGEEGGNALAAILFGDANPAGRLPITFPVYEAQLPLVYNHKPTGRGDDYYNLSGQPLFPFGYGLSYTRFEYRNIRLEQPVIKKGAATRVSFELQNTGKRAGEEVVQLYIRDMLASVARPVLELKGFQRVLLAPGETRTISFEIRPDMLEMLDANLKKTIEPGDFRIMIGSSSRELWEKTTLTVTD
jgi:beta-glucosidase